MSERGDQALVRRAKAGEVGAFDALVEKYQYRILALVGRYISDRAAVQDVAQEAFIKAWQNIGGFRGESQFYTWLYRIAVNTAKNHLMHKKRRPEQTLTLNEDDETEVADLLVDTDTPQGEAEAEEVERAVNKALAELSEDLRVAITLRELDGMSYEQIAYIMKCPVGTVRSRIFRAREAIDEQLRPLVGPVEGNDE